MLGMAQAILEPEYKDYSTITNSQIKQNLTEVEIRKTQPSFDLTLKKRMKYHRQDENKPNVIK